MALDIIFRTNNPPDWAGIGRRLTAGEADLNNYNIKLAIEELQTTRPQPDNITAITAEGLAWVVSFDSGTQLTVPVQVLSWRWRGFWVPGAVYQAFDGFAVEGLGLFYVNISHTADLTFDRNKLIGGEPAYHQIYIDGTAADASLIYDIGFFFGPKLADNVGEVLWEMPAVRDLTIPFSGHIARMKTPPSTADQVIPILHEDISIGSITFAIGVNEGIVAISDPDRLINGGSVVSFGKPPDDDATAAQLSVVLALRRVV